LGIKKVDYTGITIIDSKTSYWQDSGAIINGNYPIFEPRIKAVGAIHKCPK
jgi:hypothetical protein